MGVLRIANFDGVVPRTGAAELADNQAQQADNVRLYNRELRPWKGASKVYEPAILNAQTIFKHYGAAGAYRWLTWPEQVDVAMPPTADTADYRLYYSGQATPRKTNWTLGATGSGPYPADYLEMGVPAPTSAPAVATAAGTSTTADTRAYVYTHVSTFGALKEESAPSPASNLITLSTSQSVNLSSLPAAPPAGKYNITHIRIYRTIAGDSTGSNYAFVTELAIGTTTYNDDLKAIQLGAALGTIGWTPPPSNLKGLVSMAGGILAGFVGNTVYFSEPYQPHAWPVKYALNVPYQIVALGAIGSAVVVMTERNPFVISGILPGSMTVEVLNLPQPCVSKRSVVVSMDGCMYASPEGIVQVSPGGAAVLSKTLFRRIEWQSYAPSTMVSALFDGCYFGFFASPTQGNRAMVISPDDIPTLSFFLARALHAHVDIQESRFYFLSSQDGFIYEADADANNPFNYEWKSKLFVLPEALSFSAIRLDADYLFAQSVDTYNVQVAAIQAANAVLFAAGNVLGALNAAPVNTFPVNGSLLQNVPALSALRTAQVTIYGDGALICSLTLGSYSPVRIPAVRAKQWEIRIAGNIPVRSVTLASSIEEMKAA